ncbi:MAG: glycosyltransferase family 2 protein [Candidatus Eisenbacteria bacterium]|nr:glycosyltransferase family 2 protein [Candidatus Eisenbacteria bacterium]
MTPAPRVAVVIPALNEAASIGRVLADLPRPPVARVVVVDNGSTDNTAEVARKGGAMVLGESRRGYGQACLTGIAWLCAPERRPDILVFIDGDYSDHPGELTRVIEPIVAGRADMVIGSRVLGSSEPGALLPQARFGNWLATRLIRLFWGVSYTDLGPFRAIAFPSLLRLGMADTNYGWTVEMQVKAAQIGLIAVEVPVSYRKRIGRSKVTGTIRGTVGAGTKILWTIFREVVKPGVR